MKIIEGMDKIKQNNKEIDDLKKKIAKYCVRYSHEGFEYKDEIGNDATRGKIAEWLQGANQLTLDNVNIQMRIQKTNLVTSVTIKIGDNIVTKSIAEWILRKRKYATQDLEIWAALNDRNMKDGYVPTSSGEKVETKVIRYYDPNLKDKKIKEFTLESMKGGLIDTHLAIASATTDLVD